MFCLDESISKGYQSAFGYKQNHAASQLSNVSGFNLMSQYWA